MKKILLLLFMGALVTIGNAQEKFYTSGESGYVTSLRANLRGTPSAKGKVITVLDQNQTFSFIKQADEWFLVQTTDYVGWIHGSVIKFGSNTVAPLNVPLVPQTTTKRETGNNSPFSAVYVGSDADPTITIKNDSNKNMTLLFGGVTYSIKAWTSKSLTVAGGNYEYKASAPGVIPATGVKQFNQGYVYSWTFYIKRVYKE